MHAQPEQQAVIANASDVDANSQTLEAPDHEPKDPKAVIMPRETQTIQPTPETIDHVQIPPGKQRAPGSPQSCSDKPIRTLPIETHSCTLCSKVIVDLRAEYVRSTKVLHDLHAQLKNGTLGNEEPKHEANKDDDDMSRKGALFDVTYRELCDGADAGCHLFKTIMGDEWISREAIHATARKELDIDNPSNKLGWAIRDSSLWYEGWLPEVHATNTLLNLRPILEDSIDTCRLWASTYEGTGNPLDIEFIQFFGLWDPASKKIIYRARSSFQVFTHAEDLASSTISNRPIAKYPGSTSNLALYSSWFDACQRDHECANMRGEMPTRLLEITGTPENSCLRLRMSADTGRVNFAALSYCWGGEQPGKLSERNLADYAKSISLREQPPTLRDAVRVCHAIGLSYLWNDALCILQDNTNDKSREIAKMPSIYGSAIVTLIAARSSSASQGFLGERFPELKEGFSIPYRCTDGQLGSIVLVQLGGSFESTEPIDERAWTLQERLCSSRIIEFGSRQTRWICPKTRSRHHMHEGSSDGWRKTTNYNDKRNTEGLDLENIRTAKACIDFYGRPRNSRMQDYTEAIQRWENICHTFTRRALTLSSDRALAVSGIAQIFAELSGDQYVAGLWKSCLHSGLLWKIEHELQDRKQIRRPTSYQGPSWSWLSLNGPVSFGRMVRPEHCVAEILKVEVEPANNAAPCGLICPGSGRLVLCVRTVSGSRTRVPLRKAGTFKDQALMLGFREGVVCYATAEMDCDVEDAEVDVMEETAGILLVEIVRSDERDGDISVQGLVLKWSSPDRQTYSRVGRFSYWGLKKGRRFAEHVKDGEVEEVSFDWFTAMPKVIEVI
ncbi:hypothetical protein LTR42_010325 [Elasticomyces elasticus]|nr:hypothetical protein LTR42_010325 [Elasticomyces elasticus]